MKAMSNSSAQQGVAKRRYRLDRRAEKKLETRRRIVESAVDLHGTVGPAHTSVAQIAERAGIQRHTYYAHFPDERSLFLACSGLAMERDPLPDPAELARLPAGGDRIRTGLERFYGWYERNAGLAGCVLRDAEHHALTREMVELRMAPAFAEASALLGEGLDARGRALLEVALDFACWRVLGETQGIKAAADLMTDAITGVSR